MNLPQIIQTIIGELEQAGYAAYVVGGCVRDAALGLEPHDYDLCTAARPKEIQAVFSSWEMFLAGVKHGTVSLVTELGIVEITTFRAEGSYLDHRRPDWVQFLPEITGDLARRDFTINAMAYSPTRGIADPFGGQADLEQGILRAVGAPEERFQEDALRILRGARFTARFRLRPDPATLEAMLNLRNLLGQLARERVYSELCGFLLAARTEDLLTFAPLIVQVIPELESAVGFDQRSPHHALDLFTHIAHVTAALPSELPLRWAGLLHDVGKTITFTLDENGRGHFYGHAQEGAKLADVILQRLRAPNALREQAVWLVGHHMTALEPDKMRLRKQLSRWGTDNLLALLTLQQADFGSKGTDETEDDSKFQEIHSMIGEILAEHPVLRREDLAISGKELLAMGYSAGPVLGNTLKQLLEQVVEGRLPNTREALLEAAQKTRIHNEA